MFGEEGAARLRHSCHSQPVSIGSAERCWKAYANINCAKRNRLDPERAAKLTPRHEGGSDHQKSLSDGAGSNRPVTPRQTTSMELQGSSKWSDTRSWPAQMRLNRPLKLLAWKLELPPFCSNFQEEALEGPSEFATAGLPSIVPRPGRGKPGLPAAWRRVPHPPGGRLANACLSYQKLARA